ncbi:MAG: IS5 family transposase [Lactococcus sp.]
MKILSSRYIARFFLSDSKFKQLVGVSKAIFQLMLDVLTRAYLVKHSGSGRKAKLALADLLFMTLKYWRSYCTQLELSIEFEVGEATVHDWLVWVENTLIQAPEFHLAGNKELLNLSDVLLVIDVTENPIQRPKNKKLQQLCYSGKKKFHTLKTQVVINQATLEIIGLAFDLGHSHDFSIYKTSLGKAISSSAQVLADSGYQGISEFHKNSEIPQKKSKKHPLTDEQKQANHDLSKLRIFVEHVNAKIKVFKIFSTKYRNRRKRFMLRMNLICAIINLGI